MWLIYVLALFSPEALLVRYRQARRGDAGAQEELVDTCLPVIQAHVRFGLRRVGRPSSSAEADDLVQSVWLTLLKDEGKQLLAWDPARGMKLSSYLGLITRRILSHHLQSAALRHEQAVAEAPEPAPASVGEDDRLAARRLLQELAEHFEATLKPEEMVVFKAFYVDRRTDAEIGEALKLSRDQIQSIRHRLRARARRFREAREGA